MQDDKKADDVLTPNQIADEKKVDSSTVIRWITQGAGGIRLDAEKVGGQWRVLRSSLDAFTKAQTDASLPENAPPLPQTRTNEQGRKAAEAAKKILRKKGMNV